MAFAKSPLVKLHFTLRLRRAPAHQRPRMAKQIVLCYGPGIMKIKLFVALLAAVTAGAEDGFISLFDGKTLNGWHISAKTGQEGCSRPFLSNGIKRKPTSRLLSRLQAKS